MGDNRRWELGKLKEKVCENKELRTKSGRNKSGGQGGS